LVSSHFAIVVGLFFLFVNIVVFKGLQQPEIFVGLEKKDAVKYSHSLLTLEDKKLIKTSLVHAMENEKMYLEPELDLVQLSVKMGESSKKISQVINEIFEQNYYDFINTYRVNEAMNIFSSSTDPKLTVLEVLYKVGFNSKSSFNAVFKEKTGMTPSNFRKRALEKLRST
jgi:AraC-like DNA-binding protein